VPGLNLTLLTNVPGLQWAGPGFRILASANLWFKVELFRKAIYRKIEISYRRYRYIVSYRIVSVGTYLIFQYIEGFFDISYRTSASTMIIGMNDINCILLVQATTDYFSSLAAISFLERVISKVPRTNCILIPELVDCLVPAYFMLSL